MVSSFVSFILYVFYTVHERVWGVSSSSSQDMLTEWDVFLIRNKNPGHGSVAQSPTDQLKDILHILRTHSTFHTYITAFLLSRNYIAKLNSNKRKPSDFCSDTLPKKNG